MPNLMPELFPCFMACLSSFPPGVAGRGRNITVGNPRGGQVHVYLAISSIGRGAQLGRPSWYKKHGIKDQDPPFEKPLPQPNHKVFL